MLTKPETNRYITILSDGRFHETVPEGTEGAIKREYETSDGKKGTKFEVVYEKLEAKITYVDFQDGNYGEQIKITFAEGDNDLTLSQGVATNFGEDLLKKLPGVDFSKKVSVNPYAFADEKTGKMKKGVTLYQDGKKISNFFYNEVDKKAQNGFPVPEGDTKKYKSDDWKLFYLQARKFLVGYAKTNIVPKFKGTEEKSDPVDYPAEDINPEDIPF